MFSSASTCWGGIWRKNPSLSLSCRTGNHQTQLHNAGRSAPCPGQCSVQGGNPVPSCSLVVCSEIPPVTSTIKYDLMDIKHLINCGCQSTTAFLPFLTFKRKPTSALLFVNACIKIWYWDQTRRSFLIRGGPVVLDLTEPAQASCSQILYWFFQGKLSSLKWTWSPLPVPHLLSWRFSSEFQTKAPIPTKRLHLISAGPRTCHPGLSKLGPAGSRNLIA